MVCCHMQCLGMHATVRASLPGERLRLGQTRVTWRRRHGARRARHGMQYRERVQGPMSPTLRLRTAGRAAIKAGTQSIAVASTAPIVRAEANMVVCECVPQRGGSQGAHVSGMRG